MKENEIPSLAEYVHQFGVNLKDLTPELQKAVTEEYQTIKDGGEVLDGVLESIPLVERLRMSQG